MKTQTLSCLLTLNLALLILCTSSYCQSTYSIGVNAAVEKNLHYDPNYSVGLNIEKQFCQKNSIAVGVNYRRFKNDFSNEKTDFVLLKNFSISESFLNISVLSKYHFKYFNVSFGPSADLLLGWKNKSQVSYPYLNYLDKKVYYGLITKVSKTFAIDKNISIEPEVRYNPIFSPFTLYSKYVQLSDRQYLGLGVTARYNL